ncbi:MAG: hypothetical protein KAX57_14755 [Rhodoferax sp.]|jgi:hypothetical protein|uniref:hypothetical protein n=1 Tax=Rhodoferax sp. TaxID=50421 RepID=UPI001B67E2DD|nr:hypothetical protein [Rhodoferax sp.]MBP8288083.1 hypothetical protein [Rhodoferax sp.]MBP9735661.1 hypothetical protein [Rhodoferax sp.]
MKVANIVHLAVGGAILLLTGLASASPFDKKEALQNISFHVTSPNKAVGNTVRIVPAGLQIDNSPIEMDIQGIVTGAEVADLNADQSPEIYIYVLEPGAENRMSLLAFGANKKKSLSGVYLPDLGDTKGNHKGYCGNDQLEVAERKFLRRFPLCDKNKQPTGRLRQLQYKLKAGEAGWLLKLEKEKTVPG